MPDLSWRHQHERLSGTDPKTGHVERGSVGASYTFINGKTRTGVFLKTQRPMIRARRLSW